MSATAVTTTSHAIAHAHAHAGSLSGSPVYTRRGSSTPTLTTTPSKRSISFAPSTSTPSPGSSRSSSASSLSLTVSTATPTRSRATRAGISTRPFPSSSSSLSSSTSSSPPTPTTPSTPTRPSARRRGKIHDMASDSFYQNMPTSPRSATAMGENPTKAPSYLQYLSSPTASGSGSMSASAYALLEPLSPSKSGAPAADADRPQTPPTPTSPRLVRFDTACVLIPEPPPASSSSLSPGGLMGVQVQVGRMELRMPWGKGRGKKEKEKEDKFDLVGEESVDGAVEREEREREKDRVVIRVPIPLFRRRSSSATRAPYPHPNSHVSSSSPPPAFSLSSSPPASSHIRNRAASTSPAIPYRELQSCLVHRQHGFAEASASMVMAASTMAVVKEEVEGKEGGDSNTPSSAGGEKVERPLMPVRRPSLPSRSASGSSIPQTRAHVHVRSVSASSATSASLSPNPVYTNPAPFLADGTTPNPHYAVSETVPLRACCAACAIAMERMDEALKRGESWEERFTRGARRRRRAASLSSSQDGFGAAVYEHGYGQHGQMRGVRDMSMMTSASTPSHAHGAPVVPRVFQGLKAALDADLDAAVRRASQQNLSAAASGSSTTGSLAQTKLVPEEEAELEVEESGLATRALRVDEVDGAKRASTGLSIGLGIKGVNFPAGLTGASSSSSAAHGAKANVTPPDSPGADSVSSVDSYFSLPPHEHDFGSEQELPTPPVVASTPPKYLAVSSSMMKRTASPIAEEHEHDLQKEMEKEMDDLDLFPLPRRSPAGSARSSLRSASGSPSLNGSPRASTSSLVNLPSSNSNSHGKPNLNLSPGDFDRHGGRERQRTPSPLRRHFEMRVEELGANADEDGDTEVSVLGASLSRKATSPTEVPVPAPRAMRALPALPQSQSQSTQSKLPGPSSISMSTKALPTPPVSPRVPEKHHAHPHGFHLPNLSFGHGHGHEFTGEELQQALREADSQPTAAPTADVAQPQPTTKRERSESRTRERSLSQGQQRERGPGKRKLSLTAPFIKAGEVLRDAGADVLRGVSSMNGQGVV